MVCFFGIIQLLGKVKYKVHPWSVRGRMTSCCEVMHRACVGEGATALLSFRSGESLRVGV